MQRPRQTGRWPCSHPWPQRAPPAASPSHGRPPEHDGGSPVTSYRLELCRGVPPLCMPCCTKHCRLYLLQKGRNSKC